MNHVRATVRMTVGLDLVGEPEFVWLLRLLVIAPCLLLGSAIGQAVAAVIR